MIPTLATARLTLRPRTPDDAGPLFGTMADAAAMAWWSRPPFASVAELRGNFAEVHGAWRYWAITATGDDRALGFVAAGVRRAEVSEIGYLLARDTWGRGLAAEAVGGVIDQLFAEGQRRVFADVDPDNGSSIALLGRLGFILEGRLRGEWRTHIGVRDSLIFGLLADEWLSAARPAPARD